MRSNLVGLDNSVRIEVLISGMTKIHIRSVYLCSFLVTGTFGLV
ncbi:MAG: hypothetical protein ACI8QD_000327 [Cyclobacteriaceae bacterium]|jgi:hypothetical protein